jgi:hypothetical protein
MFRWRPCGDNSNAKTKCTLVYYYVILGALCDLPKWIEKEKSMMLYVIYSRIVCDLQFYVIYNPS